MSDYEYWLRGEGEPERDDPTDAPSSDTTGAAPTMCECGHRNGWHEDGQCFAEEATGEYCECRRFTPAAAPVAPNSQPTTNNSEVSNSSAPVAGTPAADKGDAGRAAAMEEG